MQVIKILVQLRYISYVRHEYGRTEGNLDYESALYRNGSFYDESRKK